MISEVTYRTEAGEIIAARAPEDRRPEADGSITNLADVQVIRTAGGLELLLAYVSGSVRGQAPDPDWLDTIKNTVLGFIQNSTEESVPALLREAVQAANQAVVSNPVLRGLGLTQVILAIHGTRLYLAQVGNSRAYLVRDNQLRQMTRDHTLAGELLRLGKTLPKEITNSNRKDELVRFVGKDRNIYVDTHINLPEVDGKPYLEMKPGDGIILCTNGLVESAVEEGQDKPAGSDFIRFYQRETPAAIAGKLAETASTEAAPAGRSVVVIKSAEEAIPQPVPVGGGSCLGQIGVLATVLIVSVFLGLIAAYAFPALMNPKPVPNTGSNLAQPGFIAVAASEGQVQAFQPGKNPVDLTSGTLLDASPGTKIMTVSGTTKLALADGSSIYMDRATLLDMNTIANPREGQMQTLIVISGGAVMIDTTNAAQGTVTEITNAVDGNASANGTFVGIQYIPDQKTMIVDCLRGPCQVTGSTTSVNLTSGQRSTVIDGVISPITAADYTRWTSLCDAACPVQQPNAPVVTPTFVPTPTPYLGAFRWDDLFSLTSLTRSEPGSPTESMTQEVSAAGLVPWAFLLFGGYQIGKAALKGYRITRSQKKENGERPDHNG